MNMHLVPVDGDSQSPFDVIKNISLETGAEEWSARELQPLLGYGKWERFHSRIKEAIRAAEIAGVPNQFPATGKMVNTGSGAQREVLDYNLTRYACYMVAMSCDGRKPEVAAAKTYFAIKTREAETAPAFDPSSLTRHDILTMAIEAEERAQRAELENAALIGGDGMRIKDFIKTYFTAPGERHIFEWFYRNKLLIDGRIYNEDGTSARRKTGPMLRWDHAHPTYIGRRYFTLIPSSKRNSNSRRLPRVIPERAPELIKRLLNAPDIRVEVTVAGREALDRLTAQRALDVGLGGGNQIA